MATTHSAAARNAATNTVVDLIDAGTTDATGDIKLKTSGDTLLANPTFSNPAFGNSGASVAGRADAAAIASDTNAAATGTAAKFDWADRDNTVVVSGSVTATGLGGDMEIDNTSITAGDTVAVSSATYTALSA